MKRKPCKFMNSACRRWCWSWWKFYLDPMQLAREIKWYWQRARYGYADCDLWSLDMYLASWMPSALRDLKDGLEKHIVQSRRRVREMNYSIEAWEGLRHIGWDCECWNDPNNWTRPDNFWKQHDEFWFRRWNFGASFFIKNIRSYWY